MRRTIAYSIQVHSLQSRSIHHVEHGCITLDLVGNEHDCRMVGLDVPAGDRN